MAETVSRRRPLEDEDEDDDMEAKKQRGVSYVDISNKLVDMIANIGDKASTIESSLENIVATIYPEISNYEPQILDALSQCVAYKPEKLSIYSALVGLLNARNFEFGGSVVSKLVADLDETFRTEKFDISLRIITFLSDLANARVLTLQSVLEFLESFIELTIDENLRTDFFVYAVMHALPWVGPELHEKKPKELSNILDGIEYYLNRRKKLHTKILQVWLNNEDHEQEDHLDSLWLQIKKLREEDWLERHITRIYVAFEPILADSLQHNLPSIEIPPYSFDVNYPLPRIVFRLFSPSDVPDTEPALPGSHSIDRFLVEEDVAWIIDNNHLNWRVCAQELLNYHKKDSAPLNYVIIEVIFGQLFRLPEPPYLPIFYGALLIEFCRIQPNSMPQVLAQAAEMLYQRVESMQSVCIDRFVDWFSYHLSNFQYRWSWSEWSDCLELDSLSPKLIFVREVLEKCMRLAYHSKVVEFLPEEFDRIIPPEPTIIFVLDDNTHPAYAQAQEFKNLIRGRIDADEMLDKLRRKEPSGEVGESEYDPDSVAVFTAVLLKLASKTFSHSFAALTKYHNTYRAVTSGSDEMQSVVLRTLYDCWNRHKQMMTVLVDKMLKMQILECSIIVAWVFCDDMKREFKRSWVWETLNTAITRLSRQVQVLRTNVETSKKKHRKLKEKLESMKKEKNEEEEGEIGMETDDKWGNEDEDQHMDDEKLRDLEDQISKNTLEYERFEENFRNVLLDVCHKFTVLLTEHLLNCDTENTPVETDWYIYTTGRFKHVFLAHAKEMWYYAKELDRELFSTSTIDPRILEIFNQFRALKRAGP